ncbi:MAG: hypothetical protein LCH61_06065, partial [Proteobacteria bacterium]|nr:hypothetical protein [Pseudomonadota bacterium]
LARFGFRRVLTVNAVIGADMEVISFRETGVNANITLSASDIIGMSTSTGVPSTTNQLDILVDGGDTINIDAGSFYSSTSDGTGTHYTFFNDAGHTTQIAQLDVLV